MQLDMSTAREGVEKPDDYSPEWNDFYMRNPGFIRSVGAEGVNDGGEGDAPAETEAEDPEEETDAKEAEGDEADEAEGQDGDGEDDDAEGDEEDDEQPEEIEFDFGGNKLKVPKGSIPEELAAELDKFTKGTWSDYTRKSQDVAETKKALEARAGAVEKLVSLNGEALNTYSRGLQVKAELEQLSQVNLNALWQSDPDQARRVSDSIAQKQAEFQTIVNRVAQTEQSITHAQQAEIARQSDEGKRQLERRIKGFTDKAPEVMEYVMKNYGSTKAEAEAWPLSPVTAELAYKAMLYDRMQAKTKPKPASKAAPAEPVKPMKAKGSATTQKDPDKMSTAEWVKWRESQLRKKA